jgi:hypothetical protein
MSVLDPLHLDLIMLPRSSVYQGLAVLVFGLVRPGFSVPVLDHALSDPLLLLQSTA